MTYTVKMTFKGWPHWTVTRTGLTAQQAEAKKVQLEKLWGKRVRVEITVDAPADSS